MAYGLPSQVATFEAAGDLSTKQYHFVKLDANGKVVIVAATSDTPVGVLQNAPTSGQAATVVISGVTKISADAAINEGALLKTSADGQATTCTPDNAIDEGGSDTLAGTLVIGQAYTAAGGAAEIITAGINCLNPAQTFE